MTLDESITAAEQADNELMAFYRETGIWPIGKDRPAAMGELGSVDDIRLLAWQYWQKVRQRAATLDEAIEAAAKEIVYPGMVPEGALELTRSAAAQVIRDNIMPTFDRYAKLVEAAIGAKKSLQEIVNACKMATNQPGPLGEPPAWLRMFSVPADTLVNLCHALAKE